MIDMGQYKSEEVVKQEEKAEEEIIKNFHQNYKYNQYGTV